MPIPAMSSASLKFYLLSSLILLCAISWSTGMSVRCKPIPKLPFADEIYKQIMEQLYWQMPAVNELDADAECDSAYEKFSLRPPIPTANPSG